MRGYFGVGVERISKPRNLGDLLRSAHAFGASFFFVVEPNFDAKGVRSSDTSDAATSSKPPLSAITASNGNCGENPAATSV